MAARVPDHDPLPIGGRAPTLRSTWARMLAVFLTALVTLGVLLVTMTQYQRQLATETTAHFEARMRAVVDVELVLQEVDAPAAGMMYELGGPAAYDQHVAGYQAVRGRVSATLDALAEVVEGEHEARHLEDARSAWALLDEAVLGAPAQVASGAVAAALATGDDPFREVWDHLTATETELSELEGLVVADLRHHMSDNERTQDVILAVALGTLAVATAATLWTLRMLRRRIVTPIAQLRSAAVAMGDVSWDGRVDVTGGVAELGELGRTLETTARSLRRTHDQLWTQARTDSLTGLVNRGAFAGALHECLAGPVAGLGLLYVDLDDFKVVNDSLGHAAGDDVLRVVADRLRSATRPDAIIARLGGDEFAVALPRLTQVEVVAVGERLLEALQTPVALRGGHTVEMACSIGLAMAVDVDADDPVADIVHRADQAMYIAKQQGKNRLEVFTPDVYAELDQGVEFRRELAGAAARDELELDYQPILDLSSGQVRGLEALVRWQHPERGRLAPMEFVPLAEDTGDICAIGAWVVDRACRDLAALRARGLAAPTTWVSVNVSGRQLDRPELVPTVTDALRRHGLPPAALVLEITEAVAATSSAVAGASLEALRELGVVIALDDFGTGVSTLRYLADLPIDVIKIDRSFVSDRGPKMRAALAMMVGLGQRLGLDLIAEGIEEVEDLQHLRGLGEMGGQGYYFARPMLLSQVVPILESLEARSGTWLATAR